jgi:hypothetical protein
MYLLPTRVFCRHYLSTKFAITNNGNNSHEDVWNVFQSISKVFNTGHLPRAYFVILLLSISLKLRNTKRDCNSQFKIQPFETYQLDQLDKDLGIRKIIRWTVLLLASTLNIIGKRMQ